MSAVFSSSASLIRRMALLLTAFSLSITAFCWGLTGHRVIAEIAENHLSRKAKKELKKLIGRQTLAWWSNWPDFIKSDTTWNHASPWHYVNVAPHLSKEEFVTALKNLPGKNLYTQVQATMAQLKDRELSLEQRQIALRFLVHLVGDLHQPLHVGHADDQGGNKIVVYWFDRKTNLHSVWDTWLIDEQKYSYSEYARLLDITPKEQVIAWQSSPLEDWFYESYQLAEKIYASVQPEDKLSYRYNYQFQAFMDEQLVKGGVRLAALLNQSLE